MVSCRFAGLLQGEPCAFPLRDAALRVARGLPRAGHGGHWSGFASSCDWGRAKPFGEAEATENPAAVVSPAVGEMHWGWACMVVLVMMVCGQTLRVCSPKAAAFCGLVLVFGSKLVSCDAAGLPFGMVSEPRRRLEPTLAGSLVEYLAVKMYFRVSAEFLELC